MLVIEIIAHYNDYRDEYVAFSVILMGCIDRLDTCFAGGEDNREVRLHALRVLFAIYRFYTDSGMDLDEDIPGLLVGNTTPDERKIIAGWVQGTLSQGDRGNSGYGYRKYQALLADLEREPTLLYGTQIHFSKFFNTESIS